MKNSIFTFISAFSFILQCRALQKYVLLKRLNWHSNLNREEIIVITGYIINICLSIIGLPFGLKIIPLCMINHHKIVILLRKINEYIKNKKK